ncbi:unnamed protein product [Nesidiocoris tenuis]|uniref:Uncharacterized protein n=1 Tax=Nesidiocoris tenuis TaxID=355587 RepID=A0A6H5HBH3_9HEMI|nr:unnamed protein product [Nesidiocoris tenuis]
MVRPNSQNWKTQHGIRSSIRTIRRSTTATSKRRSAVSSKNSSSTASTRKPKT